MRLGSLSVYAFVIVLMSGVASGLHAQDPDPAGNGIHKHRITKPYPHGWKNLHPVHKKANPFPSGRNGVPLASPFALASQFQIHSNQSNQPVAPTLPLWEYSVNDNGTYQGYIIGRNAFYNGHRSTTVQAYLVPVILTFPDGGFFDPTASDSCIVNPAGDNVMDLVENSPIFQTADFTFTDSNSQNPVDVGITQATDAFQRANFWTYVSPNANTQLPYHTLLTYTVLPAVNVSVPAGDGYTQPYPCPYGIMDYNWWDSYVENTLIPSLAPEGVGPSNLPIFVFDSVVMYLNGDTTQCCAIADHGSYNPNGTFQTYAVTDFDTSGHFADQADTAPLSHELGEWMNDPDNANPTPNWLNPADGGCDNTYEVGDALEGYLYQISMPNNVLYDLQELVFFSWFYGQTPSIGAGGWYSDQGTFTSFPASCSNPSSAAAPPAGVTAGGQ